MQPLTLEKKMKTLNYLSVLIMLIGLSSLANADCTSEPLVVNNQLVNGNGDTQILTSDCKSIPEGMGFRLTVKSSNAVVANLGLKLFKPASPTTISQVRDGEFLDFSNHPAKMKIFVAEKGGRYAISFRGQAVGLQVPVGGPQLEPIIISLKIENQEGKVLYDLGDARVEYGLNARVVYPSSALLHGTIYLCTDSAQ
jgi:hypothetical protein